MHTKGLFLACWQALRGTVAASARLFWHGCKRIAVRNLSNVKKENIYPTGDSTAIGTGVSKTRDRGLSSFKNAVLGLG